MKISIRIVPNAKVFKIESMQDKYKIYVKERAENNKANLALLKGLKKLVGGNVRIISGAKVRNKVLEIEGPEEKIRNALKTASVEKHA